MLNVYNARPAYKSAARHERPIGLVKCIPGGNSELVDVGSHWVNRFHKLSVNLALTSLVLVETSLTVVAFTTEYSLHTFIQYIERQSNP